MQFIIANKTDLAQIVNIYNQSIPTRLATADLKPVTVAERQEWFEGFNERYSIWKIMDEQKMWGWISLRPFYGRAAYAQTAEISIYVDQSVQHQGVGQQALQFLEMQLPQRAIKNVVALIFSHNLASINLFKRNNFEQWGHLPNIAILDGVQRSLDIWGRNY